MIYYELLLLTPGTLADEQAGSVEQTALQLLETHGASVRSHGIFEKRKLAYPINHTKQGTYFVVEFDMEPARINALERALQLEKTILRHLLIKAHRKTAKEIEQETKYKAEEFDRARTATPAHPQPAAAPAITGAQLEEKLEEILTDDMTK